MKCAICTRGIEAGDQFCGWCGSPQRRIKMQTGRLGKHEIKVFPEEVKDRYIRLHPTGQGEVHIRWELDRDSAGAPWLRIPTTEDILPVNRDSQQRIIVYGGRLPEGIIQHI